jgi:phage tail sheath protein FI
MANDQSTATVERLSGSAALRAPGVYFEWLDRPTELTAVRTDIAGFVGIATRGPLFEAREATSWAQFTSVFGGHMSQAYLAYAVEGFFASGGRTCWAVRVADRAGARVGHVVLRDANDRPVLRLDASSPGAWAHQASVTVTRLGVTRFALDVRTADGARETWPLLSMDPADPRFVTDVLGAPDGRSRLFEASVLRPGAAPASPRSAVLALGPRGLGDGIAGLSAGDVAAGLDALALVDEVSIVAIPDIMPPLRAPSPAPSPPSPPPPPDCHTPSPAAAARVASVSPPEPEQARRAFDDDEVRFLQGALVRHCELLRDRVAVLDPRPTDVLPEAVRAWRNEFSSSYAALYFPWIRIADPLRLGGPLRSVPPSGHVAGVWARSDTRYGVYKPPANEPIESAADIDVDVDEITHGYLNAQSVNVLRSTARGIRVAGARTLSLESEWRFLNVRRLFLMIEEAIESQTQWTVFEPGSPELWRAMDRVVRGLLYGMWLRGWLDGGTPEEAFFVVCDESTNPPNEIELGRTTCLIGIQPPWPAEFVTARIGRVEGGLEIVELPEGPRGSDR